jgi:hypothetical protein
VGTKQRLRVFSHPNEGSGAPAVVAKLLDNQYQQ